MSAEIAEKTERLQRMLKAANLGGVLINAQHNFAWLTGGRSSGVDVSRENGVCFLLVRSDGRRFCLASRIEMPRLLAEVLSPAEFEPVEFAWEDEKASGDFIFEKARTLVDDPAEIATDLLLSPRIRSIENLIAGCRYELTAAEAERYRRLGRDAAEAIEKLFENITPGETELEIARKAKDALARQNINPVVTLVGADARIERFRHPVPTTNQWKKIVMVVVCAKRDGLIVNLSRIACAGKVPAELRRRTESVGYVFASLLAATKPGTTGAELYRTAAAAYAEKGFAGEIALHHQGGATGYRTRDWLAHPVSGEIVRKNQAFAWNPSITGAKAEETVIASADTIETITATPDFPRLPIRIGDREYFSPDILSLS